MVEYFLYSLNCPKTGQIRYFGITREGLKRRHITHISSARHRPRTLVHLWINGLLKEGLKPDIQLHEVCNENNWAEREKFYIKAFREAGHRIYNQHDGGLGSELHADTSFGGRIAETKYKPIYQLDYSFNIIKLWKGASIAGKKLGISTDGIYNSNRCLTNKKYKNITGAGGFLWIYKDLYDSGRYVRKFKKEKDERKGVRKVLKLDTNGNILDTYSSVVQFSQVTNISYLRAAYFFYEKKADIKQDGFIFRALKATT